MKAIHIGKVGPFTLGCAYLGPLVGYSLATMPWKGQKKNLEGPNSTETRPVSTYCKLSPVSGFELPTPSLGLGLKSSQMATI